MYVCMCIPYTSAALVCVCVCFCSDARILVIRVRAPPYLPDRHHGGYRTPQC